MQNTELRGLKGVDGAGARIGVGRTLMFSLMRTEPELRPIKIGRRTLIPEVGIDAFIERKMRERDGFTR